MWTYSRKTKRQKTVIRQRTGLKFLLFLLFLGSIFIGLPGKSVKAASASITIDTSKKQVVKGDTVYVVITVSSYESIQSFSGYFSYDNRYLQFVNGGSVVHGNDDKFLIDDINRTDSAVKLKYSIKFKARKKGSTTIALQKPYKVCADDNSGSEMSVSYNALSVTVLSKKEAEASSLAQQPDTATAFPQASGQPKAQASGQPQNSPDTAGRKKASDQPKTSMNSSEPKETKDQDDKRDSSKSGTNAHITKANGKTYLRSSLQIELVELKDDSLLPDGFSKITMEIDGNEITAYALDGSTDYNYVLLYGKDTEEGFFLYDKQESAVYPYEKVKQWYRGTDDSQNNTLKQKIKSYQYVIAIMAVLCVLMLMITVAFGMHHNDQEEIWEQEMEETDDDEDKMREDR